MCHNKENVFMTEEVRLWVVFGEYSDFSEQEVM